MVAHFLRLKLRLLVNSLRRGPWQVIGIVVGVLYGMLIAFVALGSLVALRFAEAEVAASVVTVAGSAVVLGFLLVPLAFGVDDAMDPRRFALFGIERERLATGLALAALVSVPSLVLVLVALAQILTWSRGLLPALLAAIGAAAIVVTGVLGARVTTSIAAFLLSTRRARDTSGLIAIVAIVLSSPAFVFLANVDWSEDGFAVLEEIAAVLAWTPLGAAWAAPASAAAGNAGSGLLQALIGVGFATLLWWIWQILVARMLVTPQREAQARSYSGLGWFKLLPATPLWAIAARSLTYWVRDPRYRVSLLVIPIVPLVMFVPFSIAGVPTSLLWLLPVPVMALFLSWSIHNDVAYDSTAIWQHVAAHVQGADDRWGRSIPVLLAGVPLIVAGSLVSIALHGDRTMLPAVLGVSFCLLLTGLGMSNITSAAFPYPAVRPGDSPFQQPQAGGAAAGLIQATSFFATVLVSAPALGLAAIAYLDGGIQWAWASFAVGAGAGVLALALGTKAGSHIMARRGPELLAFAQRN